MTVTVNRKWETVYFTARAKHCVPERIELTIDHENKTYKLCNGHEESVTFDGDSIAASKLKIQAIQKAILYAEKALKGNTESQNPIPRKKK
jgi:hypothetical protein